MPQDHEYYMRLAIEEGIKGRSEGNSGVGTVIVRGDTVVAVGRNLVTSTNDPTAHAETVALREAGAALQSPDLSGCSLYTSFQPCPMCCGAIMVAGIERVVMGGRPTPDTNQYGPYTPEQLLEQTGWGDRVEVINGILVEECQRIR